MKKAVYIIPSIFTLFVFPILCLASSIILFVIKEIYPGLACIIMAFVLFLLLFIYRRWLFAKIYIDENKILIFYHKNIINEIKWEEVKEVLATKNNLSGSLSFSSKLGTFDDIKKSWSDKSIIRISLDSTPGKYIIENINKIKVPIKNIESLPVVIRNKLKTNIIDVNDNKDKR